jgi:predicted aldo/keto reductase-like oxidoreductase
MCRERALHERAVMSSIPRRPLGSTGVSVSMVGLGGFHIGVPKDDAEATRIMHAAIERGIDFFDNCWDYNDGKSEERMGRALAGRRDKAFLMTKLDGRTRQAATAQLEQSLERLRTDVIDLVQIHEVIRTEDPARCFADEGCVRALEDAKRAGKIRFIGFTGHKDPTIHLSMLAEADAAGFRFDTVQMPLNPFDAHFKSFEKLVAPVLEWKKIGILGMKSLGAGKLLESGVVSAIECLHYAMNLPTSVVITGMQSMRDVEQAYAAALSFRPLTELQVADLMARTARLARKGKYEEFKTTKVHDGTSQHPKWLEAAEL